jgi:hypothetical protein
MTLTSQRVTYLYDLMDAAYDAPLSQARKAPTHYRRKRLPFTPAQEQRFELRTMVERVYSRLKDEFGARFIRVISLI